MMKAMNGYVQRRISQPDGGLEDALEDYFKDHPYEARQMAMYHGDAVPWEFDEVEDWFDYLRNDEPLHLLELGMASHLDGFYYDVWYDFDPDDGGMYVIWEEEFGDWAVKWALRNAEGLLAGEFDDCDMPLELSDILALYRPGGMERAYKYATYTQQAMDALRSKNARKKRGMFR